MIISCLSSVNGSGHLEVVEGLVSKGLPSCRSGFAENSILEVSEYTGAPYLIFERLATSQFPATCRTKIFHHTRFPANPTPTTIRYQPNITLRPLLLFRPEGSQHGNLV